MENWRDWFLEQNAVQPSMIIAFWDFWHPSENWTSNTPRKQLEWLILGSKMSLERAKQKLDMYYTIRRLVPELFMNRDPRDSGLTDLHDVTRYVILPKLTPENCRTCILQPTVNDVNKFDPWLLHKYMFMVGDIRMVEDRSVGDIFVYDLAMISLGHVMKLTPTLLKKCEVAASEAYATRIRGIHFINAPPFVDRIVTMVKSVLKPKLAARMHVHAVGDLESFHRLVPKSILPKDYGGSYSTMKEISDLLRKKVDDWRDWFLEQEKVFADERLRPGPAFDENDLFGFSGSFRKLAVD
ncbi:alpha-tocopherol transfer protein-like isoform X2 [Neodiprion virginianus]|uniref:Alpha-tocopherol transfer protein-like isoform X2 n=1 Tax=Neodiprion lecontei TaxID=441921 RepID=A0ABM3FN09_NEOLC|nr:alpha-tocopherol transfer protein-like isoform X2 [Neodiprion lecontei]XP_046608746.1 alpha-tocopherol transfer protein-like isoform X2 [Neodiprion virginianus]